MVVIDKVIRPIVLVIALLPCRCSVGPFSILHKILNRKGCSVLSVKNEQLWSREIFLGGQSMGVLALFVSMIGQIVVNSWPLECRKTTMYLDALVGLSQAYLFVYGWSFLGFDYTLSYFGCSRPLYRRFDSIAFVVSCYADLFLGALILLCILPVMMISEMKTKKNACTSIFKFSIIVLMLAWPALIANAIAFVKIVRIAHRKPSLCATLDTAKKAMPSGTVSTLRSNQQSFSINQTNEDAGLTQLLQRFAAFGNCNTLDPECLPPLMRDLNLDLSLLADATQASEQDGLIQFAPFSDWYRAHVLAHDVVRSKNDEGDTLSAVEIHDDNQEATTLQ